MRRVGLGEGSGNNVWVHFAKHHFSSRELIMVVWRSVVIMGDCQVAPGGWQLHNQSLPLPHGGPPSEHDRFNINHGFLEDGLSSQVCREVDELLGGLTVVLPSLSPGHQSGGSGVIHQVIHQGDQGCQFHMGKFLEMVVEPGERGGLRGERP